MVKSKRASLKPDTHFEQVPIDIAKKVAEQDESRHQKPGTGRAGAKSARKKR